VSSVTEQAVPGRSLSLVRAVPAWAWLAGIVLVSALVRYAFGRRIVAPWIMADELIYSELAKSLAESGELRIRGEPFSGAFGVVYPLLLAPAYLLHESVPSAYAVAKTINGVLFSLAAVPTYFLGRRVLAPGPALVAAGLAVVVPGSLYSGMLMTENVYYPLVATVALALALALERPTPLRAAVLLAAVGVAFLARAQSVVFLPALLTAPLLLVAFERSGLRGLARFRWLYGLPAAGLGAVLGWQLVRGRSPLDLLGAYRAAAEEQYHLREAARWTLYHVAHLDLALGVLPFAALLLLIALAPRLGAPEQVFVAVAASVSVWLVLQVAVFASRFALRVEERNMFHLAPLFLIALVLWIDRGMPRPRAVTAAAAAAAAALPALLPFERLVNVSATSDTFSLLLWWDVWELGVPLERLWLPVLALSAALALAFALLPRRLGPVLPALVLAFFLVCTYSAEQRIRTASVGALFQGITHPQRDWIDRAVGRDADVALLWSEHRDWLTIVQNEFFSRSAGDVYTLDAPLPVGLPQTPLELDIETGRLVGPGRGEVSAEYALSDPNVPLSGAVVAADETKGLHLVRTDGPLQLDYSTSGIDLDRWSHGTFWYRRYGCDRGRMAVTLEQDLNLYAAPQEVVARDAADRVLSRTTLAPRPRPTTFWVPLRPDAESRCTVRFAVSPTVVPAQIQEGSTDWRELGVRVLAFDGRP
jgi:hypothetical protein